MCKCSRSRKNRARSRRTRFAHGRNERARGTDERARGTRVPGRGTNEPGRGGHDGAHEDDGFTADEPTERDGQTGLVEGKTTGIEPEPRDVGDRTSPVAAQTCEVTGPMRAVSRGTGRVGRPMRREMTR